MLKTTLPSPFAIMISGPINSGKTTVSILLARKCPRTAHLKGDTLRHFISWMPLEESIPFTLENVVSVACNFLHAGLNIIIDYSLSKPEYKLLSAQLEPLAAIHAFILAPRLERVLQNRGDRILTDWERNRIREMYAVCLHNPGFGISIDNSEHTPEETANRILTHLGVALTD